MRDRFQCRGALAVLSLSWLMIARAYAQSTTGVIDGVIRDPSRQAVPGVQVSANSPALIQRDLTVYSNQEPCLPA